MNLKGIFLCAVITFQIINETIQEEKIKAVQCGKEDIARGNSECQFPVNGSD